MSTRCTKYSASTKVSDSQAHRHRHRRHHRPQHHFAIASTACVQQPTIIRRPSTFGRALPTALTLTRLLPRARTRTHHCRHQRRHRRHARHHHDGDGIGDEHHVLQQLSSNRFQQLLHLHCCGSDPRPYEPPARPPPMHRRCLNHPCGRCFRRGAALRAPADSDPGLQSGSRALTLSCPSSRASASPSCLRCP